MDEIRAYCAILCAGCEAQRADAYIWLRKCRPFTALARRFQRKGITFLQTAALLGPDAAGPQTDLAVELLSAAIAALPCQGAGSRPEPNQFPIDALDARPLERTDVRWRNIERLLAAG